MIVLNFFMVENIELCEAQEFCIIRCKNFLNHMLSNETL